jgi:hypothetical protein
MSVADQDYGPERTIRPGRWHGEYIDAFGHRGRIELALEEEGGEVSCRMDRRANCGPHWRRAAGPANSAPRGRSHPSRLPPGGRCPGARPSGHPGNHQRNHAPRVSARRRGSRRRFRGRGSGIGPLRRRQGQRVTASPGPKGRSPALNLLRRPLSERRPLPGPPPPRRQHRHSSSFFVTSASNQRA